MNVCLKIRFLLERRTCQNVDCALSSQSLIWLCHRHTRKIGCMRKDFFFNAKKKKRTNVPQQWLASKNASQPGKPSLVPQSHGSQGKAWRHLLGKCRKDLIQMGSGRVRPLSKTGTPLNARISAARESSRSQQGHTGGRKGGKKQTLQVRHPRTRVWDLVLSSTSEVARDEISSTL